MTLVTGKVGRGRGHRIGLVMYGSFSDLALIGVAVGQLMPGETGLVVGVFHGTEYVARRRGGPAAYRILNPRSVLGWVWSDDVTEVE